MIAILRLSLCGAVTVLTVAPRLVAQQRAGVTVSARSAADSADPTALFPLSVGQVEPPATDRYQILAHRIDSVSNLAARLQTPAKQQNGIAPTATRLLLFSQLTRNLGQSNDASPGVGKPHAAYATINWVDFVALAGVTGLGRNSLRSSDASDQTVWESLRNAGQWAGLATAAGGASWLLARLSHHALCVGRLACRRPPTAILNR